MQKHIYWCFQLKHKSHISITECGYDKLTYFWFQNTLIISNGVTIWNFRYDAFRIQNTWRIFVQIDVPVSENNVSNAILIQCKREVPRDVRNSTMLTFSSPTNAKQKREKWRDLTQSYDKSPYTKRKLQKADNTKRQQKLSLHNDLGRSVGVTAATKLVWLKRFTRSQPSH